MRTDKLAATAHRILVNDREVLHRDVSQNNILLGRDGAPVGQRGVLVDFDMAVHGERPLGQSPGDFKAVSSIISVSIDLVLIKSTGYPLVHVNLRSC